MRLRNLLAIVTLVIGIKANATNYYFSSSEGDDSRTSLQAQDPSTPWNSIAKLNSWFRYLQPGDSILFKCGDNFCGSIVATKSGTSSSPIVLSTYSTGPKPIINGFTTVTSWTALGNGIYESSAAVSTSSSVNMVSINGRECAMGRYPNAEVTNAGYLNFESKGANSITDYQKPAFIDSSFTNATLVVRTNHGAIERKTITGVRGNIISYSGAFTYAPPAGYGYFVQNSIKTLDQFGEWYYNPVTHKISVYFGDSGPTGNTVRVAGKDVLLTVHASNLVVNNLCLKGANTYCIYNDWGGLSNLKITNCKLTYAGVDHLFMAGMNGSVIDNCLFNWANSNAIAYNNGNNKLTVTNSIIKNIGTYAGMVTPDKGGKYATAIFCQQLDSLTVLNNKLSNIGYIGVNFTYGNHVLVKNNTIKNFCTVLDDGGAIYSYTGSSNLTFVDRKVVGNIILEGQGAPEGTSDATAFGGAFYTDDNSTNIIFDGNTIANGRYSGIFIHNSRGITITNNVVFNNANVQISFQHDGLGSSISGCVSKHNQVFSKDTTQLSVTLASVANDFTGIGSFDSNYYCRPLKEDHINYTNWFYNKEDFYNLSSWQSAYGNDWHSKKTPVTIVDTSDVLFRYNDTTVPRTIKLRGTYIGLDSVVYTGSIQLAPYTSVILLKTNSSAETSASGSMRATAAAINTFAKSPGYVNSEPVSLTVKAYPNPSNNYFMVTTHGGNTTDLITLRVTDLSGRVAQVKAGITNNSTLQIGQDLMPGSYILEMIQGNKKVEQKIIKLSR